MRLFHVAIAVATWTITDCAFEKAGDAPSRASCVPTPEPIVGAYRFAYQVIEDGMSPPMVPTDVFYRIQSGMTLRELVDLLGPGWMTRYEGVGIITWTCQDGRQLQVCPWGCRREEVLPLSVTRSGLDLEIPLQRSAGMVGVR